MLGLNRLPARDGRDLQVVVESPRGSSIKIVYDPVVGVFRAQRSLPLGVTYPWDWGFVTGTRAPDGDPVDALVLWDGTSYPGVIVHCRPLAVLKWQQRVAKAPRSQRQRNDRLIVVPADDARTSGLRGVSDLRAPLRRQIEHFFKDTVFFEPKDPVIMGWGSASAALRLVKASVVTDDEPAPNSPQRVPRPTKGRKP